MRRIAARCRSLSGLSSKFKAERLLARLSGGAFVIEVLGAVAASLVHLVLARSLGAAGVGVYLYTMGWVRLLAMPGKLGMERASLRFIAAFEANREFALLRGFLARAHQLVFVAASLIGLLLFLASRLVSGRVEPELSVALGWAAVALPLICLGGLQAAVLRGFKRIAWGFGAKQLMRPALMLVLVVLALGLGGDLSSDQAMMLQVGTLALVLVLTTLGIRAAAPKEVATVEPIYLTRDWLAVSLPLLLITGFNIVLRQTDIIMVGSFLTRADAGVYGAAVRVATLISFGLNAVNAGLAPLISQLFAQDREEELQAVVVLGARLIFGFTVVVSVPVILFAGPVLAFFGPEFVVGSTVLRLLIFAQLASSFAGPVGLLMTMTGHQREAARVIGGSALLNVVLNAVLIPLIGILGAAIATTIATVAWNLILVLRVRRNLGINTQVRW